MRVRLEVVVDLVSRNGKQGVLDVESSVLGRLRAPDGMQTLATDAACEVCVQLSRGWLVLRTAAQRAACGVLVLQEAGAAHFDLGQALGKGLHRRGSSRHGGHGAELRGIGGVWTFLDVHAKTIDFGAAPGGEALRA